MKYQMQQSREGVISIVDVLPQDAPADGLSGLIRSVRWMTVLLWFMRTLAWVWLAKGLIHWANILGASQIQGDFATLPFGLQAAKVFFAVTDLFAAIGLWLAAPWGGIVWLISAAFEALTPILPATSGLIHTAGVVVNAALAMLYFGIGWLAARERD